MYYIDLFRIIYILQYNNDPSLRAKAASILQYHNNDASCRALIIALDDVDNSVAFSAADSLSEMLCDLTNDLHDKINKILLSNK